MHESCASASVPMGLRRRLVEFLGRMCGWLTRRRARSRPTGGGSGHSLDIVNADDLTALTHDHVAHTSSNLALFLRILYVSDAATHSVLVLAAHTMEWLREVGGANDLKGRLMSPYGIALQ